MRRPSYFSQFVAAPASHAPMPLLQPPRLLFRGGPFGVDMLVPRPAATTPGQLEAATPPDIENRPGRRARPDDEPPITQRAAMPASVSVAVQRVPVPFPERSSRAGLTAQNAPPSNHSLSPASTRGAFVPAGLSTMSAIPPSVRDVSAAAFAAAAPPPAPFVALPPDLPPPLAAAASPIVPPRPQAASTMSIPLPPRRTAAAETAGAGLRIGTLEIRVAAPPAASQAKARSVEPQPVSPASPAPRIARPFAAFGLSQS
jgi:hypothetical protein